MHLDILTPEKKVFTGEVDAVSLPGAAGSFTLLNDHAPIVSALDKGTITIKIPQAHQPLNMDDYTGKLVRDTADDRKYHVHINSGFVECLNNRISVLVEGVTIEAE